MNQVPRLRLFLTIGQRLYRDALLHQLLQQPGVMLVGEAANGIHTMDQLTDVDADVLIVEETLSDMDGLSVAENILAEKPTLSILLLVEGPIRQSRLIIYLEAGIKTVVSKQQSVAEMIRAMQGIIQGRVYVDPASLYPASGDPGDKSDSAAESRFNTLSAREQAVARLLAERTPVRDIAQTLGVSHKTIHTYKDRILVKLGLEQVPELILYLQRRRCRSPHGPV